MLDEDNTIDSSFRWNIIWNLERKLDNKVWSFFDERIAEQEKEEENYGYAIL